MDHVYRRFTSDDLFHTTINAKPQVIVKSGTAGWTGNTLLGTNALSLYGDVRSRADVYSGSASGLEVYPIDEVDTHSIDKVIGVPGQYPQTGSINFVYCKNEVASNANAVSDIKWYDEHWAPINLLSDWYHKNRYAHYPELDALPDEYTVIHIPEMFYGRQIESGSVKITTQAFHGISGPMHFVDDGYGRLWEVPLSYGDDWKAAVLGDDANLRGRVFYNEGLIVFTTDDPNWHNQFYSASFDDGIQPSLEVQFKGTTIMKSFVFMCRMPQSAVNASNNPTYYSSSIGANNEPQRWSKFPTTGSIGENRTYITAVGIYNEERQLVAVAKLAQPIRKRESDNIDIRLRLDI